MAYNYKTPKSPILADIIASIVLKYVDNLTKTAALNLTDSRSINVVSTEIINDVYSESSSCCIVLENHQKMKYFANFRYYHKTGDVIIELTYYGQQIYTTTFNISEIGTWASSVVHDLTKATLALHIELSFTVLVTGG